MTPSAGRIQIASSLVKIVTIFGERCEESDFKARDSLLPGPRCLYPSVEVMFFSVVQAALFDAPRGAALLPHIGFSIFMEELSSDVF